MNKTTTPDPHDLDRIWGPEPPKPPELSATARRERTRTTSNKWKRLYRAIIKSERRDEHTLTRKELTERARRQRAELNN